MVSKQLNIKHRGNIPGKVKQKRNPRSRWESALKEFETSSLSVKDFCAHNNLSVFSFYKWRQVFKREETSPSERPHFIPLQLEPLEISLQQKAEEDQYSPEIFTDKELPSVENDTLLTEQRPTSKPVPARDSCSSGLSLHVNKDLKISIDKRFHEPTLKRLVGLLSSQGAEIC